MATPVGSAASLAVLLPMKLEAAPKDSTRPRG